MAREPARELQMDEVLTQYGSTLAGVEPPFRRRPRFDKPENDISAMLGPRNVADCTRIVTRRMAIAGRDGVRHARVEDLVRAGFTVRHTPSRANRYHVSIEREGIWADDEDTLFDSCWTEPEWEVTDDE